MGKVLDWVHRFYLMTMLGIVEGRDRPLVL